MVGAMEVGKVCDYVSDGGGGRRRGGRVGGRRGRGGVVVETGWWGRAGLEEGGKGTKLLLKKYKLARLLTAPRLSPIGGNSTGGRPLL